MRKADIGQPVWRSPSARPRHGLRRVGTVALVAGVLAAVAGLWVLASHRPERGVPTVPQRDDTVSESRLLVDWQMDEPEGSPVMRDSSENAIDGAVGVAVQTGRSDGGATVYRWPYTPPGAPPPKPGRLIRVTDPRLNPADRQFAITIRFKTTADDGNIIQKGQSTTPGGYFKWEIPDGQLACLFRSRDQGGDLIGERAVSSPIDTPLNDGQWHTVRCEKTSDRVTMTIDEEITVASDRGPIGPIANDFPMTIGGKMECDEVETMCDYFVGSIDYVQIEIR